MHHIKLRVCAWLTEDRLAEETVTDGVFAAFLRGVLYAPVTGSTQIAKPFPMRS